MLKQRIALLFAILFLPLKMIASTDNIALAVWANEAIVATYTYNYQNFLDRQKEIAHYFTSTGWINYSKALQNSKLPDTIKDNSYYVSAVATLPPIVTSTGVDQWQAVMPLLVVYKNPQYQQKQTLEVTIHFQKAPKDEGVRGLEITDLSATIKEAPCQCKPKRGSNVTIT